MGYLTVQGRMMTYSEYKDKIEVFKLHGIRQFLEIYNAHKENRIDKRHLHWGDEIEYSLYYFEPD